MTMSFEKFNMSMASMSCVLLGSLLLALLVLPHSVTARNRPRFTPGPWKHAHATFYEGDSGSFGGACGYRNVVEEGYGLDTVALSDTLFKNGESCGACYDIQCVDSPQWCKPGQPTIHVTTTNHCPPNYDLPSDNGGWCNAPREHFDIAKPAFLNIAEYKAGIVPVIYRRVPCQKKGGIRFTITGNPYYNEVAVWNVGGAGDVISVQVKGDDKLKWTTMKRLWGQRWITDARLVGESLTFRVEASDRRRSTSWHITGSLARPLKARTSDRNSHIISSRPLKARTSYRNSHIISSYIHVFLSSIIICIHMKQSYRVV